MTLPLMVFAAGLGTRMGALAAGRPKPLIPVGGRPLLDHALALARGARARPVVVNVHRFAGQVRAHLAGTGVLVSDESALLLDTGGGLRAARPLLGQGGVTGPVWTLNSDAAWTGPNPLLALLGAWREDMDALLLLVPRARALGHAGGDFDRDARGRLARGAALVYTGAQIVRTEGLDAIPDPAFSLNRLWDRAAARGRLFGAVHAGGWCDVGRPESIALAEAMLAADAAGKATGGAHAR